MSEAVLDTRKVRSWRKYPSYQTIELDWIDRVPDHWIVKRLKWSITACQNGIWGDEPTGDKDDVGCVRVADFDRLRFVLGESVELTNRSVPKDKQVGRLLNRGDLLLEKSGGGDNQPVGALVLFDSDAIAVCSNFVAKVTVADGYCGSYLRYLHACLYASRVNTRSMKQATGIQNLDSGQYFDEKVAFPSLDEQRAIAAFLDRETTRIDALVAKKQQLIDLLEEKKQSVLRYAVTSGLNDAVSFRDSKYGWLGKIPDHWKTVPIKYAVDIVGGMTPSKENKDYWRDGIFPWVSPKDMKRFEIDDSEDHITEVAIRETTISQLPINSVLIVIRGMILARYVPVAINTVPVTINQDMKGLLCKDGVIPRYLAYQLQAIQDAFFAVMEEAGHGTLCLRTNLWDTIAITVPPEEEQREICDFVDTKTALLNKSCDKIQISIQRLLKYRTALISAAVTGQIDVREEVQLDE
jgi:type I restriction enzyme S subunit